MYVITNPVVGSFQMTNYTFISDDLNENIASAYIALSFFYLILYSIMKL